MHTYRYGVCKHGSIASTLGLSQVHLFKRKKLYCTYSQHKTGYSPPLFGPQRGARPSLIEFTQPADLRTQTRLVRISTLRGKKALLSPLFCAIMSLPLSAPSLPPSHGLRECSFYISNSPGLARRPVTVWMIEVNDFQGGEYHTHAGAYRIHTHTRIMKGTSALKRNMGGISG